MCAGEPGPMRCLIVTTAPLPTMFRTMVVDEADLWFWHRQGWAFWLKDPADERDEAIEDVRQSEERRGHRRRWVWGGPQ